MIPMTADCYSVFATNINCPYQWPKLLPGLVVGKWDNRWSIVLKHILCNVSKKANFRLKKIWNKTGGLFIKIMYGIHSVTLHFTFYLLNEVCENKKVLVPLPHVLLSNLYQIWISIGTLNVCYVIEPLVIHRKIYSIKWIISQLKI